MTEEATIRPIRPDKTPKSGVSPRVRFEVFKRDGFTCQYCARKTPQVVLELDHIIPRAEGGGGEMENLVTSCWECNRGKGARLLDDRAPVIDMHEQAVLALEREMQLREYNAVKHQVRERVDEDVLTLRAFWEDLFGRALSNSQFPYENSIRYWLRLMAMEDIKDYMEVASLHYNSGNPSQAARYLAGIMKNVLKDATRGDPSDVGQD